LNVGVFHPSLGLSGGAELVALVITNTLAENGYDVILYTAKKVDQKEMERVLGLQVHSSVRVVVKRSFAKPRTLLDIYHTIPSSAALKKKCDVLIDTYSNFFFPWVDICYTHFPLMNRYVYNTRFPYINRGRFSDVCILPYLVVEKNYVNTNNKGKLIIANSQFTAQAIKDFLNVAVNVLQPPVLSSFYQKRVDSKSNENLVVTVSRFDSDKGLETISHIAKLTAENVKFIIIGLLHNQNVLKSVHTSIQKLNLSHKVSFLPNISQTELQNILKRAKVYLHTTLNEHFGISIAEAMAMGCIPIVHNSGGVTEFVPEAFRYNTIQEAAKKIGAAINNWTPANENELAQVVEKFKEDHFSKGFLTLFEQYERNKETAS
jgi:glycosyltransferase involved in cell wall biosynthesis